MQNTLKSGWQRSQCRKKWVGHRGGCCHWAWSDRIKRRSLCLDRAASILSSTTIPLPSIATICHNPSFVHFARRSSLLPFSSTLGAADNNLDPLRPFLEICCSHFMKILHLSGWAGSSLLFYYCFFLSQRARPNTVKQKAGPGLDREKTNSQRSAREEVVNRSSGQKASQLT